MAGQFIDCHEIVVVVEFLDCWELSVLLAVLEWHVRISESEVKNFSLLWNDMLSSLSCLIELFLLLLNGLLLLPCHVS